MNLPKESIIQLAEVRDHINIALTKLFKKDLYLFQVGVHERTITHKFAEYLQEEFRVHSVDCEYNRDGLDIKMIEPLILDEEERKEINIFPDIIIHIRGKNDFNKLVIEIKSSNLSNSGDIQKLKALTSSSYKFKYKYGLFVRFNNNIKENIGSTDDLVKEVTWFVDGNEVTNIESI
jgi:hypothetical protein